MNLGLDVDGVLEMSGRFNYEKEKGILKRSLVYRSKIRTCLKCKMFSNVRRNRGRRSGLNTFGSIA